MIKLENYEVMGWEHAIRGMRNPMNSWGEGDTHICHLNGCDECESHIQAGSHGFCTMPFIIGPNDHKLMMQLRNAGTDHRKYMRMITVYVDITAPLYWWKEFDTYKVGTVANSCSTMHKIHEKEFTLEDFSCEKLIKDRPIPGRTYSPFEMLRATVQNLNICRELYVETKDKEWWEQMIQLLPTSYNQKRTIMLNYEVLANMYKSRKNHKLDEWKEFCQWVEKLPYSEIITGGKCDVD